MIVIPLPVPPPPGEGEKQFFLPPAGGGREGEYDDDSFLKSRDEVRHEYKEVFAG